MLSALAKRRLIKLADYMASLPRSAEKHFRMQSFAEHKGDHDHKFPRVITKKELNLCGTSACALGWASTIPSFRRAGLKLVYQKSWGDFIMRLKGQVLIFGWYEDDNITELFPGLLPRQANRLFDSTVRTKTPKQWAKHCRKFLKENS